MTFWILISATFVAITPFGFWKVKVRVELPGATIVLVSFAVFMVVFVLTGARGLRRTAGLHAH